MTEALDRKVWRTEQSLLWGTVSLHSSRPLQLTSTFNVCPFSEMQQLLSKTVLSDITASHAFPRRALPATMPAIAEEL